MRPRWTALLLTGLALGAVAGEPGPAARIRTEEQGFQRLAQQWLAAYNSGRGDRLEPMYAPDAQYLSSHVPGLVAQGRDQVMAYLQAGMSRGGHMDSLEVLSVTASCRLATVLCEYRATNAGEKAHGRSLLLFRKEGPGWIIYLHMTVV